MHNYKSDQFCNIEIVNRIIQENIQIRGQCGSNLEYEYDNNSYTLNIIGSGQMDDYNSSTTVFLDLCYITQHINIGDSVQLLQTILFIILNHLFQLIFQNQSFPLATMHLVNARIY